MILLDKNISILDLPFRKISVKDQIYAGYYDADNLLLYLTDENGELTGQKARLSVPLPPTGGQQNEKNSKEEQNNSYEKKDEFVGACSDEDLVGYLDDDYETDRLYNNEAPSALPEEKINCGEKIEKPNKPILKWNWGAFMLNFPFAIGTYSYLCLLSLVPFLNIIWVFVSGARGSRWALDSGKYKNYEEFNAVMSSWNRAGLISFIIALIVILILVFSAIILILYFNRNFTIVF